MSRSSSDITDVRLHVQPQRLHRRAPGTITLRITDRLNGPSATEVGTITRHPVERARSRAPRRATRRSAPPARCRHDRGCGDSGHGHREQAHDLADGRRADLRRRPRRPGLHAGQHAVPPPGHLRSVGHGASRIRLTRTTILEVRSAPARRACSARRIDVPAPADQREDWSLDVRGWVIGAGPGRLRSRASTRAARSGHVPVDVERPRTAADHPGAPDDRDRIPCPFRHAAAGPGVRA